MRAGAFDTFFKHLGATFAPKAAIPESESLEAVAAKALGLIYMADVGRFGNPPATHHWWNRDVVKLDGRLAHVLEENGLVEGRSKAGGIPAEVRLTKKGAFVALSDLGKGKS